MLILNIIFCAAVLLFLVVIGSCLWSEKAARISPTPSLPWVRKAALDLLHPYADPNKSYSIAELGCGWGGTIAALRRQYPQAHIVGYETSFWPWAVTRARARKNTRISRADIFAQDISGCDIIFCYLSPHHMEKLKPQFQTMKPGSLIVSNAFPIHGWIPTSTVTVGGPIKIPVFLYKTA